MRNSCHGRATRAVPIKNKSSPFLSRSFLSSCLSSSASRDATPAGAARFPGIADVLSSSLRSDPCALNLFFIKTLGQLAGNIKRALFARAIMQSSGVFTLTFVGQDSGSDPSTRA